MFVVAYSGIAAGVAYLVAGGTVAVIMGFVFAVGGILGSIPLTPRSSRSGRR